MHIIMCTVILYVGRGWYAYHQFQRNIFGRANLSVQKQFGSTTSCFYPQTQFSGHGYVPSIFKAIFCLRIAAHSDFEKELCMAVQLVWGSRKCLPNFAVTVFQTLQLFFCWSILRVFGQIVIRKIECAGKDSSAAAKLFMTYCIPRLALPKSIPLEFFHFWGCLGAVDHYDGRGEHALELQY